MNTLSMARKKKELTPNQQLARAILDQYQPKNVEDMQNALKDIFGPMFEAMLQGEMNSHLGYSNNERGDKETPNRRNGYTKKTLKTTVGDVPIEVPRDREGTFEPVVVPKRKRDVSAIEDKVLAMYAKGMSQRDIADTIEDIYGFEISHETISEITDSVLVQLEEWQNRPLKKFYTFLFVDCLYVTIRKDFLQHITLLFDLLYAVFLFLQLPFLFWIAWNCFQGFKQRDQDFLIITCQPVPHRHKGLFQDVLPDCLLPAFGTVHDMLITAPLDFLIGLADIYFLSPEGSAAFPADNPAAEGIPALIGLPVLRTLDFPAVFINLTHSLRFFPADNRFVIIRDQILGQFSVVMLLHKWNTFRCVSLLVEHVALIHRILQDSLDHTVLPAACAAYGRDALFLQLLCDGI